MNTIKKDKNKELETEEVKSIDEKINEKLTKILNLIN
jgi:hypothetical protein